MHFTELDTPALCVDLDVLEKNIRDLQNACDQLEIGLRVHTKTHKTPAIARLQIAAGAIGIVSQKLGEAEAMADGGIQDIPDSLQHRRPAQASPPDAPDPKRQEHPDARCRLRGHR